ncbi:MAG: alpha/beta hydrolase, partial [Patescibacteria group bacterium]
ILPGGDGANDYGWFDWLKQELEKQGYKNVTIATASILSPADRAKYYESQYILDKNSVLVGHSFGALAAMKWIEQSNISIHGLLLVDPSVKCAFEEPWEEDEEQRLPYLNSWDWQMDLKKVRGLVKRKRIIGCEILGTKNPNRRNVHEEIYAQQLDAPYIFTCGQLQHFSGKEEPIVLENLLALLP